MERRPDWLLFTRSSEDDESIRRIDDSGKCSGDDALDILSDYD